MTIQKLRDIFIYFFRHSHTDVIHYFPELKLTLSLTITQLTYKEFLINLDNIQIYSAIT